MGSFQKLKGGCCGGEPDHKIMLSRKMTMFNMLINGLCWVPICGLLGGIIIPLTTFIPAVILILMFLYMEKCCGFCCLTVTCCNIQDKGEVFDPDQDEVVMEEAQVQDEEPNSRK